MLRKLVFRLFLCLVALMSIAFLTVCVAGYLAFRQPDYYTDLRDQPFSEADQAAAKAAFRLMENELRRWSDRSVALQRTQSSPFHATILPMMPLSEYDPQPIRTPLPSPRGKSMLDWLRQRAKQIALFRTFEHKSVKTVFHWAVSL